MHALLHIDTRESDLSAFSALVFRRGAASHHSRISIDTDTHIVLDDRFELELAGLEGGDHLSLGLDLTKLVPNEVFVCQDLVECCGIAS